MRRLFKSIYFYIVLILLITAYFLPKMLQPNLISIPVVFDKENLMLIGEHFGESQGKSSIEIIKDGKSRILSHYMDWSDSLIRLEYTPDMKNSEIIVKKRISIFTLNSNTKTFLRINKKGLKNYDVPVQQESPWPTFRRNRKNTAFSPIKAIYNGASPWMVQTDKGIFSTPVIDKNENIYIGSADHIFYSISSTGKIVWQFKTGEIIDSGAALLDDDNDNKTDVIVPSGDGYLYKLRTDSNLLDEERIIWKFSSHEATNQHFNNWFEGNVAIGYSGEIYAGNTNFNYYCLSPTGKLNWQYTTKSNNWSIAAIANDGTIYWGSNDNFIRAVSPQGKELWRKMTLGFIAASAAIGSDGTIYIGSFDSYLYALDPYTGKTKWRFKTNDHIYASVALDQDNKGNTTKILFGSADGFFYALDTNGNLVWKYYTQDVIRSSAAISPSAENDSLHIVYFGAGNGNLYALNTNNGSLRWKYNTTSSNPELADRNDLNASIALGKNGIYTAGEHGQVWFIPYDYPLHHGENNVSSEILKDGVQWNFISSGGNLINDSLPKYNQTPIIALKLDVIENGSYVDANICNMPFFCSDKSLQIDITPKFDFKLSKSADGHYVYIIPDSFVRAGNYQLHIKGNYYLGGWNIGNLKIGGSKAGTFDKQLKFIVEAASTFTLATTENRVNAFELTRITAPMPPMLPSLNQIGFDYMDWGMSIIRTKEVNNNESEVIVWTAGLSKNKNGQVIIAPENEFLFPMKGIIQGNNYRFENQNMTIPITGIPIPFNQLILSGDFRKNYSTQQATLYADTKVMSIPSFGKYLVLAGLANNIYKNLNVVGSFVTKAQDTSWTINKNLSDIKIKNLIYLPAIKQDGDILLCFEIKKDSILEADQNFYSICLIDKENFQPIYLDYKNLTRRIKNVSGETRQIGLKIPEETILPKKLTVIFIVNLFPVNEFTFESDKKSEISPN